MSILSNLNVAAYTLSVATHHPAVCKQAAGNTYLTCVYLPES